MQRGHSGLETSPLHPTPSEAVQPRPSSPPAAFAGSLRAAPSLGKKAHRGECLKASRVKVEQTAPFLGAQTRGPWSHCAPRGCCLLRSQAKGFLLPCSVFTWLGDHVFEKGVREVRVSSAAGTSFTRSINIKTYHRFPSGRSAVRAETASVLPSRGCHVRGRQKSTDIVRQDTRAAKPGVLRGGALVHPSARSGDVAEAASGEAAGKQVSLQLRSGVSWEVTGCW